VLEESLERLFVGNPDFVALEQGFSVFCPFEAVGMVNQEIKHAHFLSYITDPRRPHGFGVECLKALLHSATKSGKGLTGALTPLDVHLLSFEGAIVRREWRNIDLMIEFPAEKLAVAIELKINASEGGDQLSRYKNIVGEEWPITAGWRHTFLFMSKRGERPSEQFGSGWQSVPLVALANELDEVVKRELGNHEARDLLRYYIAMLRSRHVGNNRLEQLAQKLWAEHREALTYLMEQRPDITGDCFSELRDRLADIARSISNATGLTLGLDDSTNGYLRIYVKEWDSIPDMVKGNGWTKSKRLVLLEIERGAFRVKLQMGPGDAEARQRIWEALVAGKAPVRGRLPRDWKMLASEPLAQGDEGDETTVTAVEQQIVDWCAKVLVEFDKALATIPR
jgi:hypothetical protein